MAGKYQYSIYITVSEHYCADVEADNYEEAEELALDMLNNGELDCTSVLVDTDIGWTDEEN